MAKIVTAKLVTKYDNNHFCASAAALGIGSKGLPQMYLDTTIGNKIAFARSDADLYGAVYFQPGTGIRLDINY